MVDLRVMAYFLVPHCVSTTCKQESLCVRLVVPPFHHEGLGSVSIEFLLPNDLGWPLQHEVWLWSETVVLRDVTWVPCPVRAIPAKETSRLNVCTSESCTHVSQLKKRKRSHHSSFRQCKREKILTPLCFRNVEPWKSQCI